MECLLCGARLQNADTTPVQAVIGGIQRFGVGCYRCTTSRLSVVEDSFGYYGEGDSPIDYDNEGNLIV